MSSSKKDSMKNLILVESNCLWSAPVSTMTDKTTIGGYIKKALLTIPAFLGLK